MGNPPSNIFQLLILLESYHQNGEAVLAATGMNGLNDPENTCKSCYSVNVSFLNKNH